MDGYKKFILTLGVVLIIVTLIFIKLFILKNREVKSNSLIEHSEKLPDKSIEKDKSLPKKNENPDQLIGGLDVKLSGSDPLIKKLLESSSNFKGLEHFLDFNDLILRFTSAIDNISRGESPVKNLDFLEPFTKFKPWYDKNNAYMDISSYERYDKPVRIFDSFDSKKLTELYLRSKRLINEAYKKLGYSDGQFDDTLYEAMRVLLKTPKIDGKIFLQKGIVVYKFKKDELEKLNNAQKHFLRMGPENIKKVKSKIIEIGSLLGFKF